MSTEAGAGEWGYAGQKAGGQPTYRWQEPGDYGALRQNNSDATNNPAVAAKAVTGMADGATAAPPADTATTSMRFSKRKRLTVVTVGVLGVIIALILMAFFAFGKEDIKLDNLLLVSVIFRHGDRTPTETYPNDPHKVDVWPDGLGALTNEGKAQMFSLGQRLRDRYGSFVGALYSADVLRVDSSGADRCLMSAGAMLAGLMPPQGEQRWHPDLDWQPIPVHYVPRAEDTMIAAKKTCPRFNEELQKVYDSPEILAINEENKDLYTYLTTHAGKPINNILEVEHLYNTLLIEKIHNLELPEWTKSVFPEKMKPLAAQSLAVFTHNNFMKRIRGGPLLKDIVDRMSKKAVDPTKTNGRMYLYSAHDLTIVNVWRTVGFTELLNVGYGASLVFELRWIEQGVNLEVKVLYFNSSSTAEPTDLQIPGCGKPCDLGSFMTLVQNVLPTDWDKECGLPS